MSYFNPFIILSFFTKGAHLWCFVFHRCVRLSCSLFLEGVPMRSSNGRNTVGQQLQTLFDVTRCVRLHTLLHVVTCFGELSCCTTFETGQKFSYVKTQKLLPIARSFKYKRPGKTQGFVTLQNNKKAKKDDFSVSETGSLEETIRALPIRVEPIAFWFLIQTLYH